MQRKALSDFFTFVLDQLELGSWRITLLDEHPPSTDAAASISAIYGRPLAELRLQQGFFDLDLDHIEHYLIHEACHLFSEGIDTVVQNGPESLMGKPAFTMFFEGYKAQMEMMTDRLAYVLAGLLDGPRYRTRLRALKPVFDPPTSSAVVDGPPKPDL